MSKNEMEQVELTDVEEVVSIFEMFFEKTLTPHFKEKTITNFLGKLSTQGVMEAMHTSCVKFYKEGAYDDEDIEAAIKYFCGICWRTIKPVIAKDFE